VLEFLLMQIMNVILWVLLEPEGRLALSIGWVTAIMVLLIVLCYVEGGGSDGT